MNYYIYLTTNLINGKKYIGQHKGKANDNYLGSGKLIQQAIKKYGKENFKKEILEFCSSQEETNEKEKFYIQSYNAVEDENFYNILEGGNNNSANFVKWRQEHPEEYQEQQKEKLKKAQQWQEEHSKEMLRMRQNSIKKAHQWQEAHPEEVKKQREECAKKMQQWRKEHPEQARQMSQETIKKAQEARKKKIECITTGEVFNSLTEAANKYKISVANLSKCLKKGQGYSCGKHPETNQKLEWKLV